MLIEMPDFVMEKETGKLWCKGCLEEIPVKLTRKERSWFGKGKLGDPIWEKRRLVIKQRLMDVMTAHTNACAQLRSMIEARIRGDSSSLEEGRET